MECRIRLPAIGLTHILLIFAVALAGFMAVDRTVLHWYVPEVAPLDTQVEATQQQADRIDRAVSRLSSRVEDLESKVSSNQAGTVDTIQSGQIGRLSNAVAILSLLNAYGGFQSTVSPAGRACVTYLSFGIGSITDCGFQHVEEP